jgi:hypothetical protein
MATASPVKFTVAICTWNRASSLFHTLDSLTRIEHPTAPWEMIVVNNNCTDQTESVLDRFVERLPLRRVFEANPGVSNARNTALRHATGEFIAWTDDDVLIDRDWLCAYERAVKQCPEAAVFGGPVRPRFEGTPPSWLVDIWPQVEEVFAIRELGKEPLELDGADNIPYGPNFVVRRREQQKFPYDPNLGRKGEAGMLGEETAVVEAIIAGGGKGWWVPDAIVEHCIPKTRQTIEYLRTYYTLLGKTHYRQNRKGTRRLRQHRSRLWYKAVQFEMLYHFARLGGNPHRWLKPLVEASILWGALRK